MWSMRPNTRASVSSRGVRLALVVNPASGSGRTPVSFPDAIEFSLAELDRLESWAPSRIAVAGGARAVAPGAAVAGRLGVPLAVIPVGTANDFARASGLPLDVST